MEAPEKVYFTQIENGMHYYTECVPLERNYIEYVRKEAFIEKALKFLDENFFFDKRRYSIESGVFDSKEEMFEDFKKNMEVQEQKPTWSEDDERMLNSTIWHLRYSVNNGNIGYSAGRLEDWLKSLKDRIK